MDIRLFWTRVIILALVLHSSLAFPRAEKDSSSQSDEDDTQQQQQQNVDTESLEEFTKKITKDKVKGQEKVVEKLEEAVEDEPCFDEKRIGPCKAAVPRFFFSKAEGKCKSFIFGGCGQNSRNNFKDLSSCETTCAKHLTKASILPIADTAEEICDKPAVTGGITCEAYMTRWTYNSTQSKCVQFIDSGCGRTKNNFANKYTCESTCAGFKKDEESTSTPETPSISVPTGASLQGICHLPMDKGFCYAIKHKYYFNKQNNRCEVFEYGGCGGNSNRFNTPEDCVRACGGDSPAEDLKCSQVDCPWSLYTHYTTLDCKPIYDGQSCCPTRFDCPDKPQSNNSIESGRSLTSPPEPKCFYKGKSYAIGENVEEASDTGSCRAACICTQGPTEEASIMCASIECPENLGALPPGKAGCTPLHKRASCCAYDFFCPNDTLTIIETQKPDGEPSTPPHFKCNVDGISYYENQRFYPKKEKCLRCICQKGFNETLSEEFCENIDCGIEIYYSHYLAKGCAPVYFQSADGTSSCCPISWECPEDQSEAFTPLPPSSSSSSSSPSPVGPVPVTLSTVEPTTPSLEIIPLNDNRTRYRLTQDVCQLPKVEGNCKANRRRYFYNTETSQCEQFNYTGCNGNSNNFVAFADCERLCNTTDSDRNRGLLRSLDSNQELQSRSIYVTEVDPCTLPKKQGNCKGYFPRYYYNPQDNSCQLFIFGGCRRNSNNFYSKEACEATCTNTIPVENLRTSVTVPAESGGDASMVRFGDSSDVSLSSSKSASIDDVDPCNLPSLTGKCRAFVKRFYYDSQSQQCKEFIYGGCTGNGNNFLTARDCERRCIVRDGGMSRNTYHQHQFQILPTEQNNNSSLSQDNSVRLLSPPTGFLERCRLPMKSGSCLAIIPSYFYDVQTNTCNFFLFSGCMGNANRFKTLSECEGECKKSVTTESEGIGGRMSSSWRRTSSSISTQSESTNQTSEHDDKAICDLPASKGSCKAQKLRYHFDPLSQQCLPFVYSGCGGNKNNFLSESDCLSLCGKQPTIEQLTSEGILSCTFGNEILPLGATVGGKSRYSSQDEVPCGVPVCQCVTPPSVTCVQISCKLTSTPEPPPPPPKICAMVIPNCESNCKPSVDEDGCPMCDCEETKSQVQLQEVFAKSVKG